MKVLKIIGYIVAFSLTWLLAPIGQAAIAPAPAATTPVQTERQPLAPSPETLPLQPNCQTAPADALDASVPVPPKNPNPKNYRKKYQKKAFPFRLYLKSRATANGPGGFIEINLFDMIAIGLLALALGALVALFIIGNPALAWLAWAGVAAGLASAIIDKIGCRRWRSLLLLSLLYLALLISIGLIVIAIYGVSVALAITLIAFLLLGVFFVINWWRWGVRS